MRVLSARFECPKVGFGTHKALAVLLSAVVLLSACGQVPRQPEVTPLPVVIELPVVKKPIKIGLALGGGAARGFAHIGVIQVLEEAGIRADLVVGTSAGSVVAALYASGRNGLALQKVAEGMDEASFSDWRLPLFRPGVLKGDAIARFINTQLSGKQIQELPIPLGVVATDLHSGTGILFRRGDVGTAVRASSSIPAVFQPVNIAGHDYVDGGLVSPVPVGYARQMGADLVIAVDISSDPESNKAQDMFQVLMQTFTIMGRRINTFELQGADVVVRPMTKGLPSASFGGRLDAIQAGRLAMLSQLPRLRSMLDARAK